MAEKTSWEQRKVWNDKKLERSQHPDHSDKKDLDFTSGQRKATERF